MPAPPPRRSAAGVVALLLSLLALGAAGYALWSGWQAQQFETQRSAEIRHLQSEVDSLRLRLNRVEEPFGPSAETTPPASPTLP
jgi:uncharacterized protein HemX